MNHIHNRSCSQCIYLVGCKRWRSLNYANTCSNYDDGSTPKITPIAMLPTIAHGRKRKPGAGRKKGEKTVVIRVPERLVPDIKKLLES